MFYLHIKHPANITYSHAVRKVRIFQCAIVSGYVDERFKFFRLSFVIQCPVLAAVMATPSSIQYLFITVLMNSRWILTPMAIPPQSKVKN